MKSWSLTFATQMLFRCSGSELFDTFKNIILLRTFPLWNIYSWKMLRKLKWQIPGEPLAARNNWCQGPVPGRGPAVEKHCSRTTCVKLTNVHQYYLCEYHLHRILPKSDNECGKYGRKLIYALNQIMAFTAPVFMKLKSLSGSTWTSYIPLFIHIGAKRSKNGQKNYGS